MEFINVDKLAEAFSLSRTTATRIFNSDRLPSFYSRMYGKQLCTPSHLIEFLHQDGASPLTIDMVVRLFQKTFLFITQDQPLTRYLTDALASNLLTRAEFVPTAFEAGQFVAMNPINCLAIDFSIGPTEAVRTCRCLRRLSTLAGIPLIAILPEDARRIRTKKPLFCGVFYKPHDMQDLKRRLQTIRFACQQN